MQDLKDALHRLSKINPSEGFIRQSKIRLIQQIELQKHESWFKAFLMKIGRITPSEIFVMRAKIRLMERINAVKKPAFLWLRFTKRLVASTLVMFIAVTTTLFFVEGGQTVNAAEDTYIEILSGSATLKHADKLIWDEITAQTELSAGDLIRLAENSEAVIHFFDDTELRLAENSSLLISQLAVSPSYSRQGIIEVSLHEGRAWVQALNVDDGYANFILFTRDSSVSILNASFNVEASSNQPTKISSYRNKLSVQTLNPETRGEINTFIVPENEQVTINISPQINPVTEKEKVDQWVQDNLNRDQLHISLLRENGINQLRLTAGTLPGDMLYPIKQAKERLKLAFSFDEQALTDTQIEIANKRLNEAIVLLEEGNRSEAMEALLSYQSIAKQVAEKDEKAAQKLVIPHQKTLVASLPTSAPIGMVKNALNQTEELTVDDPIEREKLRLQNSIDHLKDVAYFVESGDVEGAKEALVNHQLIVTSIVDAVNDIDDEEKKKNEFRELLNLRNEELELLSALTLEAGSQTILDNQLTAMLESASKETEGEVERVVALITPIMPDIILESEEEEPVKLSHIDELVAKIYIYKTWQGQQNQINKLLKEEGNNAKSVEFLSELRNSLDGRARDYINMKILEIERTAKINKSKAVKRKIDRAKRLRDTAEEQ